ncbi:tetratricopeptide repeat protein 13-like [Amphiura filiformis]|uniref:tetratricopeptide repeat protein 13-like n=1 Tax=Amphiura filiformis TaxID=82378 RepID=UPI003B2239AE
MIIAVLPSVESRVQVNLDLHLQKINNGQPQCSSTRTKLQLSIDPPMPRGLRHISTVQAGYKDSNCAHCGLNIPNPPISIAMDEIRICDSSDEACNTAVLRDQCQGGECPFDQATIKEYALAIVEKGIVPFATGDEQVDFKIAYGVVLLNMGYPDQAIAHLSELIDNRPDLIGAYHARGAALAKKGIQFPVNAELAINDFSKAIRLDPQCAVGWERRAEIYSALGRTKEALNDVSKAIEFKPSARLYNHRGTINFKEENYFSAAKDFEDSVKAEPNQPDTIHLMGLAVYHQGKIREAIKIYEKALELKHDFVDCFRSLAHAYRELGDYETALTNFNQALIINPMHVQSLQLRGSMFYQGGFSQASLRDFKACLTLEPYNEVCQYMKGLSYAAMGQYYEAIKSNTKLMVSHIGPANSNEFDRVKYIREYSRYLHSHLDTPMSEYSMDEDINGSMKDRWVKGQSFSSVSYKEQPGLDPEISDVDMLTFYDLSEDAQTLLCKTYPTGFLMQYDADGFLPSVRAHVAMGLASVEVAQALQKVWTSRKAYRLNDGRKFGWREMFDIAVKWRRLIDPDQPVFWLDQMPNVNFEAGYNNHMNLVRGQVSNIRFSKYFDIIFNLTKKMVMQHGHSLARLKNDRLDDKFPYALEKIATCDELLQMVKKMKIVGSNGPGFMVSTKISSTKEKGQKLEGALITLTGDSQGCKKRGNQEAQRTGNVLFSLDTATTRKRTEQYHAELDFLWQFLVDEVKKDPNKLPKDVEFDVMTNIILSIAYYFYNLMPLSRGTSSVAYAVALGLILSLGREVTGRIPRGKVMDVEAILAGSPEAFATLAKSWMDIKVSKTNISSLPSVEETFPTLRYMLEVMNAGVQACNLTCAT